MMTHTCIPELYTELFKEAIKDLDQCLDNPDVCYAISKSHQMHPYVSGDYDFEKPKNLHKKGGDLKNQFETLELELLKYKEKPTIEDFLKVAEEGYHFACITAAKIAGEQNQDKRKQEILERAVAVGYAPALIELVNWCLISRDFSQAYKYFEQAGNKGVPGGYINAGYYWLGNPHLIPKKLWRIFAIIFQESW